MNITQDLMKYWDAIDMLKVKMQNNSIKSKKNLEVEMLNISTFRLN